MANEKRLIDANALIEQLDEYIQENREQDTCANNFCADVCEVLKNTYVKDAPTVDAVEVVHGEWGKIYTCHGKRLWVYKCSQCEQDGAKKSNYCPNCGAKMDGGNEDGSAKD